MILVGQYDSPFVRRAAVTLHHHGFRFERKVLSVFADFDAMLEINPLGKVPTLLLDGGEAIYESRAICEYLESRSTAGSSLVAEGPDGFRDMLRSEAVGTGLAEKIYERGIEFSRKCPQSRDPAWTGRLERQIRSACDWLETRLTGSWFAGDRFSRADIAVTVALTYLVEKQPHLWAPSRTPALYAYRLKCEAMPAFSAAPYSASEAHATGWRPENTG